MESKFINDTYTNILTVSAGETISSVSMIFCNTNESEPAYVDIYLVPQDGQADTNPETQIVKQFEIPPTDTMLWSTERFIMTQGYKLVQKQDINGQVTCNLSYLQL